MLLPEESQGPVPPQSTSTLKWVSVISAVCALGVLVVLSLNALSPNPALLLAAQALALVSVSFGLIALAIGVRLVLLRGRDKRRPVTFLLLVTLVILLAHLYIIDAPPTATDASVSGSIGSTFGDGHLLVDSALSGTVLSVHLQNIGTKANDTFNAIGGLTLYLNGYQLSGSNLRPDPTYRAPLQPRTAYFTGAPTETFGTWSVQATGTPRLTVDYQYLTCYHVPDANDTRAVFGCVMDESYYVPSALSLLAGTHCAPYADNCNLEHPPLAKALIAGGIAVFGLGDFGWRISSVILGTLCLPLLFVLVETMGGDRRLSYFATLVFAADILFFVHSSAALIDVPTVFFSLVGFVLYFRRASLWGLSNYLASGVFLGLAALSKETALFAIAALVTYELLFGESGLRASAARVLQVAAPAVLVFAGAVQLYDTLFSPSSVQWFYNQVAFMLNYGIGLKGGGWCLNGGACPNGPFITPLHWLTAYSAVSYLVTTVTVSFVGASVPNYHYIAVGYYGIANLVIVWMVYLWLPIALWPLLRGRKWRSSVLPQERFGAFVGVWFLWAYVPYVVLWLYGRVTYPFYILPAMPALAAGAAYFITRPWFPRKMAYVYVLAALLIFFVYFPVKDFLPEYLRALLGR